MRLLADRRFALLFAGSALNAIGTWAALIALWGYAAYHFHAGAHGVAIIGLAWALPAVVVGPVAGIPIDRLGPRQALIAADAVGVAAALGLAAAGSFPLVVVLAFVSGTAHALGRPAAMSLPPRLARDEDLLAANALLGAAEQSSIVFGPLIGAAAISTFGMRAPFLFDAATFAVGAVAVLPLRLRGLPGPASGPAVDPSRRLARARRELSEGLIVARRVPVVRRALVLAAAVYLCWGAFFVLEPLYVHNVLHRSPAVLGLFQTIFGVGLVGTTLLLPRIGDRVASVRALASSVAGSGVAAGLYVGTASPVIAAIAVFAWGMDVAFFVPPLQTVLQRATPVDAHGRVMGLTATLAGAGNVVAIPLTGLVVGALGVSPTGLLVGALAGACGLAGVARERRPPLGEGARPAPACA